MRQGSIRCRAACRLVALFLRARSCTTAWHFHDNHAELYVCWTNNSRYVGLIMQAFCHLQRGWSVSLLVRRNREHASKSCLALVALHAWIWVDVPAWAVHIANVTSFTISYRPNQRIYPPPPDPVLRTVAKTCHAHEPSLILVYAHGA